MGQLVDASCKHWYDTSLPADTSTSDRNSVLVTPDGTPGEHGVGVCGRTRPLSSVFFPAAVGAPTLLMRTLKASRIYPVSVVHPLSWKWLDLRD